MKNHIKRTIFFLLCFLVVIPKVSALTKAPIDITTMTIEELTKAMDTGLITSEQLVSIYLDRIEEYNAKYNAILYLNENALKEAKELDKKRDAGEVLGPLHGIPIVVKTNIDVKGLPTTAGASILKDNIPTDDSDVVKKLKDAGAIILGNTNMSQFAFSASNSNSSYGRVRNAYNTNYSPYGSSGGSAVAVAASFATAALGTDTNSSVRVPASANNLVGIRPTQDLLSSKGVIPYDITRDTVGILTKTVSDNALILNVLVDGQTNYQEYTDNRDLKGIKIGVINSFLKGSSSSSLKANSLTYSEVYNMMISKIKAMEEMGAEIVYIDDFFNNYQYLLWYNSLAGFTFCKGFNEYIKNSSSVIENFNDLNNVYGYISNYNGSSNCNYSKNVLMKVYGKRTTYQDYVNGVFEENDIDVIIYPNTKNKLLLMSEIGNGIKAPSSFVSSAIGYPSITVPLGFDSNNLPYGIEFLAKANEEQFLYKITSAYENSNEKITTPSISPLLYKIPESVSEVVDKYYSNDFWGEEFLYSEYEKIVLEVKKDYQEFFKTYNDSEDVESRAKGLLDQYAKMKEEKLRIEDEHLLKKAWMFVSLSLILGIITVYGLRKKKELK